MLLPLINLHRWVNLFINRILFYPILLAGFVMLTQTLHAQELVLSGKIVHQTTGIKVPFANVGIKGTSIGTVSNDQGEFELHFANQYLDDTLQVSCIGFFTFSVPIATVYQQQPARLSIVPRAYALKEVTITPDELSAEYIVNKALLHIPDNYLSQSYLTDGFYREYFSENGSYVGFAEAAVSIFDPIGYPLNMHKASETIKVNQLRVSDIYNKGNYVLYIDLNYALRANLIRNADFWQEFAKQAKSSVVQLQIDSIAYYDEDLVYCIGYKIESKRAGSFEGRLFIRKNDYAVLRLELNALNEMEGREENGAPYQSSTVMTYKDYHGKLYLHYAKASHDVTYYDEGQKYDLAFYSELTITNLQPMKVSPLPEAGKIKPTSIFYQPRYRTFDPDFWQTYSLFEKSPHNRQIIADLEQKRPLKEQYPANGKLKLKRNEPFNSTGSNYYPHNTGY